MSEKITPWICTTCGKTCTTKGNLKAHEILHTNEKKFSCRKCAKKFKTKACLKIHKRFVHDKILNYECDVCGRTFCNGSNLKTHKARHERLKPYVCEICNKGFCCKKDLNYHVNSKLTHNVSCRFCKQIFPTRDKYKQHLRTHSEVKKKSFFCEICNKKTTSKSELKEHNKSHGLVKSLDYTCEICKKTFLEEKLFQKHSHKKLKCGICQNKFISKDSLRNHLWNVHVRPKQKCNICLNYFRNLKLHKVDVHEKKRIHKCDFCKKSFHRASLLKRHYLTHTNERPYTCNLCNQSFSQKKDLKRHIFTHSNERPYSCDLCNLRFSDTGTLKQHILTHSGERPYSCNICNANFTKKFELKKHTKSKTCELFINSTYCCKLCGAKYANGKSLARHNSIKHIKKPEKNFFKQTLGYSLNMTCNKETNIKPILSESVGIDSKILVNESEKIVKEPRIRECYVIVERLRTLDTMAANSKYSCLDNTLLQINLNELQKFQTFFWSKTDSNKNKLRNSSPKKDNTIEKNLLMYGFTSTKSKDIKESVQKNENDFNQMQKKNFSACDSNSDWTLQKKKYSTN